MGSPISASREQKTGAASMSSRPHVIDAIQQINHSAQRDWLERFTSTSLRGYLKRLELTLGPRGRSSMWTRTGETPAVVTRQPAL
jgi:hypothetical protein